MSDPTSFTAEHRSWQWELVLQYEDGSLPASSWNEPTLTDRRRVVREEPVA